MAESQYEEIGGGAFQNRPSEGMTNPVYAASQGAPVAQIAQGISAMAVGERMMHLKQFL